MVKIQIYVYKCEDINCETCDFNVSNYKSECTSCKAGYELSD